MLLLSFLTHTHPFTHTRTLSFTRAHALCDSQHSCTSTRMHSFANSWHFFAHTETHTTSKITFPLSFFLTHRQTLSVSLPISHTLNFSLFLSQLRVLIIQMLPAHYFLTWLGQRFLPFWGRFGFGNNKNFLLCSFVSFGSFFEAVAPLFLVWTSPRNTMEQQITLPSRFY